MKYKRSHFIGGGILCVLLALALFSGQQLAFRLFALFLFLLALASFAVAIFGKAWRKPREAQPKEEPHREQPAAQPKQEPRGTQPAAQPGLSGFHITLDLPRPPPWLFAAGLY